MMIRRNKEYKAVPVILVILMIFGIVSLTFCTGPVKAHDAMPTASQPLGWTYPWACCSGQDCREVASGHDKDSSSPVKIYETAEGYVVSTTREVIPYNSKKVKESPDGLFHWCSKAGSLTGETICLFVPPRGY